MIWRRFLVILPCFLQHFNDMAVFAGHNRTSMIWRHFLVILSRYLQHLLNMAAFSGHIITLLFTALKWYGDISWSYHLAFYSTLMIWRHILVILPCLLQHFYDMAAFPGHIALPFTVLSSWYGGISWSYYIACYSTFMIWRHFLVTLYCFLQHFRDMAAFLVI